MPANAWADAAAESAGRCAVRYMQVALSEKAPRIIANYEQATKQERAWRLIRSHDLYGSKDHFEFADAINRFAHGQVDHLVVGPTGASETLFPERALHEDLDSGDPSREESAIAALADCDRIHGFTPVFARTTKPVAAIGDFDCAVTYWVVSGFEPLKRDALVQRTKLAAARHHQANPGQTPEEIGNALKAAGRKRGERIMVEAQGIGEYVEWMTERGREVDPRERERRSPEANKLRSDLAACEMKYGLAKPRSQ